MKFMNENLQIPKFINENMAERSFDLSTLECLAWFQFNASAAAPQSLKQRLKYPNINIPNYSLGRCSNNQNGNLRWHLP